MNWIDLPIAIVCVVALLGAYRCFIYRMREAAGISAIESQECTTLAYGFLTGGANFPWRTFKRRNYLSRKFI
jgi:hypothetical protein